VECETGLDTAQEEVAGVLVASELRLKPVVEDAAHDRATEDEDPRGPDFC